MREMDYMLESSYASDGVGDFASNGGMWGNYYTDIKKSRYITSPIHEHYFYMGYTTDGEPGQYAVSTVGGTYNVFLDGEFSQLNDVTTLKLNGYLQTSQKDICEKYRVVASANLFIDNKMSNFQNFKLPKFGSYVASESYFGSISIDLPNYGSNIFLKLYFNYENLCNGHWIGPINPSYEYINLNLKKRK